MGREPQATYLPEWGGKERSRRGPHCSIVASPWGEGCGVGCEFSPVILGLTLLACFLSLPGIWIMRCRPCPMMCPQGKELPWTSSLGSRGRAWPPQPRSTGITRATSTLLTFSRRKHMLQGNKMHFAALDLNVKLAFGFVFV